MEKSEGGMAMEQKSSIVTLEKLQKRAWALQDIEEIKKMHREYVLRANNRRFEEIIDYFAENATVEIRKYGVRKGKEEIAKLFNEVIARNKRVKGRYMLIQPVITIEGNTARGHWIMDLFSYESTASERSMGTYETGRYDCEYVKEGEKWKFGYLKLTSPWPELQKKT
jgi:ketosteroid isomerase-like protein